MQKEKKAPSQGDFAESKLTIVGRVEDIAAHFGMSRRTIYNWLDRGMPRLSDGNYDLVQIALWLDKKGGKEVSTREKEGKTGEAELLIRAKRELAELTLQERRGELISLADLEELLSPRARAYRQGLISLEQTLAPRLAALLGLPPESLRVIHALIRQACREILDNILRPIVSKGGQVLCWEPASGSEENDDN